MKKILLVVSLLISSNILATDFMGGIIESRIPDDYYGEGEVNITERLGLVCIYKNSAGVCEKMDLMRSFSSNSNFQQMRVIYLADIPELINKAKEYAANELNDNYKYAGFYSTLAVHTNITNRVMLLGNEFGFPGYLAALVTGVSIDLTGLAVDIVKSPIVGISYGVHKVIDASAESKIRNILKFLMDENEIGKIKSVSYRFQSGI
jgi:hypothetical protein